MIEEHIYKSSATVLNYYEIKNDRQPLVLIHAQGVDSTSFDNVWTRLSEKYHIYAVDCYGHGKSLRDPEKYNIKDIGDAIIHFAEDVVKEKFYLLGHSSGGLIAAYTAANTDLCDCLILEDPPLFASQGERRKSTFNYVDLSTVCHNFKNQSEVKDFVLYYFANQYAWKFFPEKSREKLKSKMTDIAAKYRKKHPQKNLKVMFWPKIALSSFKGMNNYDPAFGTAFYDDSFHSGIPHEDVLKKIKCRTVFMKAKTDFGDDGILFAALNEDDLERLSKLVENLQIVRFDCGHGIHVEKPKEFTECLLNL